MAVYTEVDPDDLAHLVSQYGIGTVLSCKGIAEGVENSNYLLETTEGRFILTLYEKRVQIGDLPFFIDLLDHLAQENCPVPAMLRDKNGVAIQEISQRSACIIQFLTGISLNHPSAEQCRAAGAALARMHLALQHYPAERDNSMGQHHWLDLYNSIGDLSSIDKSLSELIEAEHGYLSDHWPQALPRHVIHADLFPDNVLMLGNQVTGLIDFYFAATDFRSYDLAITHAAWCFSPDGSIFYADKGLALMQGYASELTLLPQEIAALPTLARGASMRFLLTRAHDWIHTPPDALVTRKDPAAFLRRLEFYQRADAAKSFAF